jgi:hypothetical protein
MKRIYFILLLFLVAIDVQGSGLVSIEDFKKVTREDERQAIIRQAPPEQKEVLTKIDLHLSLVQDLGGEAQLKRFKEGCVSRARGFVGIEGLFNEYIMVFGSYANGVMDANKAAGMPVVQQREVEMKLSQGEDAIRKNVDTLLFNLAASPEALELNRRANALAIKLNDRTTVTDSNPFHPITTEERKQVDKQMDQIFSELERLPKLTPEEAQKEYDAFTEEQVREERPHGGMQTR